MPTLTVLDGLEMLFYMVLYLPSSIIIDEANIDNFLYCVKILNSLGPTGHLNAHYHEDKNKKSSSSFELFQGWVTFDTFLNLHGS